MRTKKTKAEFATEMQKRIEIRKTVLEFYENVFCPMLALNFDGKVYNARLFNRLNEEVNNISPLLFVRREYTNGEISICMRYEQYNYNDYEQLCIKVVLEDGRISYDKTMADTTGQAWLNSFKKGIEDYQKAIDHYDEYMEVANKMEEALLCYNNLPYTFRGNMETQWMRIY